MSRQNDFQFFGPSLFHLFIRYAWLLRVSNSPQTVGVDFGADKPVFRMYNPLAMRPSILLKIVIYLSAASSAHAEMEFLW